MTAIQTRDDLLAIGVRLELSGDATDLIIRAPKGVLTPDLLSSIQAEKGGLLLLLLAEVGTGWDYDAAMLLIGSWNYRIGAAWPDAYQPLKAMLARCGSGSRQT
jgi:hypothetical protein